MQKLVVLASLLAVGAAPTGGTESIDWASHPENTWVRQSPRDRHPIPKFVWGGSGGGARVRPSYPELRMGRQRRVRSRAAVVDPPGRPRRESPGVRAVHVQPR